MQITPESRVLDIGAGPGTLAVPLAGIVRHVTAVEPPRDGRNASMRISGSRGSGTSMSCRRNGRTWISSADLDCPYDVVVASYSLGVPDLKEALLKMDAASGKYVYIFWFADMQSPWRRNYGRDLGAAFRCSCP